MKHIIGIYEFELDNKNNIHVYEYRNYNKKYFDMISANKNNESKFISKCKEWYMKNVLLI